MRKFWIAMLAAMLLVLLPVASLAAVWVAGVEMAEGQYLPVFHPPCRMKNLQKSATPC